MEFLKNLAILLFFGLPVVIITVCLVLMVLSMSVEAITGIDLIREHIRPFFGNYQSCP